MAFICIGVKIERGIYWTYIESADEIKDRQPNKPYLSDGDKAKLPYLKEYKRESDAQKYCAKENEKVLPT